MCLVVRGVCDGQLLRTAMLGERVLENSECDIQSIVRLFTSLFSEEYLKFSFGLWFSGKQAGS